MNSVDFKFPFFEGDMIKWKGKLWYVQDVLVRDMSVMTSLQSVENSYHVISVPFDHLDLRRKDFLDAMKPNEQEIRLVEILFDDFHEGYFMKMDHTLDAMSYMIQGLKGQGFWYKNDS